MPVRIAHGISVKPNIQWAPVDDSLALNDPLTPVRSIGVLSHERDAQRALFGLRGCTAFG